MPHARIPRWLRIVFKVLASLLLVWIAFVCLAMTYLGWNGEKRWAAVQQEITSQGETLDFQKLAPPPIPDAQNFCAIPALKDIPLISGTTDPNTPQDRQRTRLLDTAIPNPTLTTHKPALSSGPSLGIPSDISAWAAFLRKAGKPPAPDTNDPAQDILSYLSRNDSLIAELAAGLSRPESQWTPAWRTRDLPQPIFDIEFPHNFPVSQLSYMLCLRAIAAAHAGNPARAHQSILIATRLTQANMQEPFIMGTLLASASAGMPAVGVWELCNAHSGSADDFRTLQQALTRLDYRSACLYGVRTEMIFSLAAIYRLREHGTGTTPLWSFNGTDLSFRSYYPVPPGMPQSWCLGNAATSEQWYIDYFLTPLRDGGFRQFLDKQREFKILIDSFDQQPFYKLPGAIKMCLAIISARASTGIAARVIYAQSLINQAIAACALERYRIEHNNTYPDTLAAANHPGEPPIPLDIISGQPMHYRKTPDGRYTLWCIGFDGKDDNAQRDLNPADPTHGAIRPQDPTYKGDWVWSFPGN
jgi:hypothetical protein